MNDYHDDDKKRVLYYAAIIVAMLSITFIGLYLAGETDSVWDFLLNLKDKRFRG